MSDWPPNNTLLNTAPSTLVSTSLLELVVDVVPSPVVMQLDIISAKAARIVKEVFFIMR
jgi:hypothetical protein